MFGRLGWTPIIWLRDSFSTALMKEFYANMQEKKKSHLRESETIVKGVPISFDRRRLAIILSV
jgi:hypothetical protein